MSGACRSRPYLTVDVVVLTRPPSPWLLLIRRAHDPFAGAWALPGGYVEDRERTRDAAVRELEEETGVRSSDLALVGVYDDPHRDPRGWTVSVAYAVNFAERTPAKGGDDAREARWFPVGALPPLAFDHGLIIDDAVTAANGAVTA